MYRLVNAATGTGKTIAYLAPIIHHLQGYSPKVDRSHGTFGMRSIVLATILEFVWEVFNDDF